MSKVTHVGLVALTLAGGGALLATAQTAPSDGAEATAQVERVDHRSRDGHRGGQMRRGGRGFGGEMFRTVFDAADVDGDGSVTAEEVDAYRAAQIAAVDTSGDGALTIEEFDTLYRAFTRSRMVDAFQALDADGDSVISPTEIDTSVARLIERLDRDGDGTLTLQRPGRRDDN
ncbi:MAG: hypothetical protein AAGA32_11470 [Pseudomonadota bacterium]